MSSRQVPISPTLRERKTNDLLQLGMLASASTIHVVAESLRKHDVKISVVDPVLANFPSSVEIGN